MRIGVHRWAAGSAAAALVAASAVAAAPSASGAPPQPAPAASGQNTWTFFYTGAPQVWVVPAGVTRLTMRVVGGAGAHPNDQVGRGGVSGMVIADFTVTPGQQFTIWVGQGGNSSNGDGGWGWGCGGTHGTARVSTGRDGGAGGGASAVSLGGYHTATEDCTHRPVEGALLAVAGGGGGGGGDGFGIPLTTPKVYCVPQLGGRGGDGGQPATNGDSGQTPQCGKAGNGGAGGASANANGHNGHDGGFLGGAGGGGGGGYRGGDAGGGQENAAGGGGGGGSSYVSPFASRSYLLPGTGAGDGTVVLTSGVTEAFTCTNNQVHPRVPAGMGRVAMTVIGGQGGGDGGDIAQGGSGAEITAETRVTPGDYFTVYVGCYGGGHGGWGFFPGGDHGLAPDPAPKDGGGGGGSSAVVYDGADPDGNEGIIVAGGGGGGGGKGTGFNNTPRGYAPGGQGGNAGTAKPLKGRSADFSGGGSGGCYGCESGGPGARGENSSLGSQGGGGGGGGGGWFGGGGGGGGDIGFIGGTGGGGGGGGSSLIEWGSQSTLENITQGTTDLTGNGLVILQFTPGTGSVATYGGSKQRAVIGQRFTAPLAALVSDEHGHPVRGVLVTFDLAPNGGAAYGTFPGGKTTAVAVTLPDGVATSPPITATTRVGAWEPQATVPGLPTTAGYQLYNARYPVHLSPGVTPNPATALAPMQFAVTARAPAGKPVPTGQVEFYIDDHLDATGTLDSTGKATVAYDPSAYQAGPGKHTLRAHYEGDATHAASNATIPFTVDQIVTAVTLTSSKNPSGSGEPVSFTASITTSGGAPKPAGQQVTFAVDGATFDTVPFDTDGTATSKSDTLPTGTHVITATFRGDTDYLASHGTLEQHVGTTSTGIDVGTSPVPAVAGEPTRWSATIFSRTQSVISPTGGVLWETTADTGPSASGPVAPASGGLGYAGAVVRLPPDSQLISQSYDMVAKYSGDGNFAPSEARFTQTWVKAPVTVTVTHSDSAVRGDTSTLSAQVKPPGNAHTPNGLSLAGTMQFAVNGVAVGKPVAVSPQGKASLGGVQLPGSWSTISATYSGNQWLKSGTGSIDSSLETAPTTTSLDAGQNPMGHGASTRLTARVANTASAGDSPVGTVQFRVDGLDFGDPVPVVDGLATSAPLGPLASGRHNTEAIFVPASSTDYTGSRDTLIANVLYATATTVGTPQLLLTAGAPVTVTAQVTPLPLTGTALADPAPTGTVRFSVAGATLPGCAAVPVRNGRADCTVSDPALTRTSVIHAAYSGSGLYAASAGDTTQEVIAGHLADTGAPVRGLTLLAALLLAAGTGLTLLARRRRAG